MALRPGSAERWQVAVAVPAADASSLAAQTLLKMLQDSSPMVHGNAALSLVRFGDASGRPQIVALLQPAQIAAPVTGHIVDADRPGLRASRLRG